MPDLSARQRLEQILRDHREFRAHVIPLCAAETAVSPFVRSVLVDPIHEQYAMGGPLASAADNFIGSEHVLELHRLTIDLCRRVFDVPYADPRPLSGTAGVTSLLMTLSKPGQRVLLQTPPSGGHASMVPICQRLGLTAIPLPYDFERFNLDPLACREVAEREGVDFVLFAPSDILFAPPLAQVAFPETATVIYDATQTLGLIASRHLPSPFDAHPRLVLSAGTHKTLPGPSSGLLLTRNAEIAERIDAELSPKFVRHSHPHHTAALCATLIEHAEIGERYGDRIRALTTTLSASLSKHGLRVLPDDGRVSETHQVFLHTPTDRLDIAYQRCSAVGITLNVKRKPLFDGTGIRLGVQEIARYQWTPNDVITLAGLLARVVSEDGPVDELRNAVRALTQHNRWAPDMVLSSNGA